MSMHWLVGRKPRRVLGATVRAVWELRRHPLRTGLALLGLIAGVSSVITVLAIAEGAGPERRRELAQSGANQIVVQAALAEVLAEAEAEEMGGSVRHRPLSTHDLERIQTAIDGVSAVMPMREAWGKLRAEGREAEGRRVAVLPAYLELTGQKLARGRRLADDDVRLGRRVAVVGSGLARAFFGEGDGVGRSIRFEETLDAGVSPAAKAEPARDYVVVGVTTSDLTGKSGTGLADFAMDITVPLEVAADQPVELTQMTVTVDDVARVRVVARRIEGLLAPFHAAGDCAVIVSEKVLAAAEAAERARSLFLATVAAAILTIGGMGIMTIMLATVSERTREIGLRRAMGARRRDILEQFVVEAGILCFVGAAMGLMVGLVMPGVYARVTGIAVVVRPWTPVVAFGAAVGIGVLFGAYPAYRAARVLPAEALRSFD